MGDELMIAPNTDATPRGKIKEHQNLVELVM
jgi:hypothetical protein